MDADDVDMDVGSEAVPAAKSIERRAVTFAVRRSAESSEDASTDTGFLGDRSDKIGSDSGDEGEDLVNEFSSSLKEGLRRMSQVPEAEMHGLDSDDEMVDELMLKMNELMVIAAHAMSSSFSDEVAPQVRSLQAAISRAVSRRCTLQTENGGRSRMQSSVSLGRRTRGHCCSEDVMAQLERMMGHIRSQGNGCSESISNSREGSFMTFIDTDESSCPGSSPVKPCGAREGRWTQSDFSALSEHLAGIHQESCEKPSVRVSEKSRLDNFGSELREVGSGEFALRPEIQRLTALNRDHEERAGESQARVAQLEKQLEMARQELESAVTEHRQALTLANQDARELSEVQASHLRGLQSAVDLRGRLRARERELADLRWSMEALLRENERLKSYSTALSLPARPPVTRSVSATPVPGGMLLRPVGYDSAVPSGLSSRASSRERHSPIITGSVSYSGPPGVFCRAGSRERYAAPFPKSISCSGTPPEVQARGVKLRSPASAQLFLVSAPCQWSSR